MGTGTYLTLGQIVTEGLELGGNPGLVTRATTFCKLLADHIFRAEDWEWLLKSATIQADASNFGKISNSGLPTDYRAVRQLFATSDTSGTVMQPVQQVPYEQLLINILNDNQNSITSGQVPTHFAVDMGAGAAAAVIYLWPKPDHRVTFNLRYYQLPDVSAYSAGAVMDFPDSWSFVGAVAHYAQSYDKETLQSIIQNEARSIIDQYRLNHRDAGRASVEVVPMDQRTFPTLRQDSLTPWPKQS